MIRCINCGRADLKSKVINLEGSVRGESYVVQMRGMECPRCGYKTIDGPDTPEFTRLLADRYRSAHGLLTSEQIRGLRKSFHESQEQFAQRLGVGIASVKRWEMGKIQDERSNGLILEKTRVPVIELEQYHFTTAGTTAITCSACATLNTASGTLSDVTGTCVWSTARTNGIFRMTVIDPKPVRTIAERIVPWMHSVRGHHA